MSAKAYTAAASYFHWLVAAPLIGSVVSIDGFFSSSVMIDHVLN